MKPKPAKPDKSRMRFFTPELYRAFNSVKDQEADRAAVAWEKACLKYNAHLRRIGPDIPPESQFLLTANFHDASLVSFQESEDSEAVYRSSDASSAISDAKLGIVTLGQGARITALYYVLWDHLHWHQKSPSPHKQIYWLYEEIDLVDKTQKRFVQRVLLSDLSVLEIPFISAVYRERSDRKQKQRRTRKSA